MCDSRGQEKRVAKTDLGAVCKRKGWLTGDNTWSCLGRTQNVSGIETGCGGAHL